MNENSEIDLVKNLKNDDKQAFEIIFNRFHNQLHNFAKGYVIDHEVARGLVQESFIKLWELRAKHKSSFSHKYFQISHFGR